MITAIIFTILSSIFGAHSMGDELSNTFRADRNSILILPFIPRKTAWLTRAKRYHPDKIDSKTSQLGLVLKTEDVTSVRLSWPDEGNEKVNEKVDKQTVMVEKTISQIVANDIVGLKISKSVVEKNQISRQQMRKLGVSEIYDGEAEIDDNNVISYDPASVVAILVTKKVSEERLKFAKKIYPHLEFVYHSVGGNLFLDEPPAEEVDEPVERERTAPAASIKRTKKEAKQAAVEEIKRNYRIKSNDIGVFVHEYKLSHQDSNVLGAMMKCKALMKDMGFTDCNGNADVESWLKFQYDQVQKVKNPTSSAAAASTHRISPSHSSNSASKTPSEISSDDFDEDLRDFELIENDCFESYLNILGDFNLVRRVLEERGSGLNNEELSEIALAEGIQRSMNDKDATFVSEHDKAVKVSQKTDEYKEVEAFEMAMKRSLDTLSELEKACLISLEDFSPSASSSAGNSSGIQFDISKILLDIGLDPEPFRRLNLSSDESTHFKKRINQLYQELEDWEEYKNEDEELTDVVLKFYNQWKEIEFDVFDVESLGMLLNSSTHDNGQTESMPSRPKGKSKKGGKRKK